MAEALLLLLPLLLLLLLCCAVLLLPLCCAATAAAAAGCSAHALLWPSLHAFVWAPALQTPSPTCPHSRLLFTRQFASKLVSTVETMDASGSTSFESGGWAAEGGGGDEWR